MQRIFNDGVHRSEAIFELLKDIFIKEKVVFFGAMANRLYSRYMPKHIKENVKQIPDFDVLSENPEHTAEMVKAKLRQNEIKEVSIKKHKNVGELISIHYEVKIGEETVAFIYEPLSCHSFNIIHINKHKVRIATIDTMLSFYLAFLYSNRPYFHTDRILCMCQYLFMVQEKNRLNQKGLLKRFTMSCIGTQATMEDIRAQKSELFNKLKANRNSKEFQQSFLKYTPNDELPQKPRKQTKKKAIKKKEKKTLRKVSGLSSFLSWLA